MRNWIHAGRWAAAVLAACVLCVGGGIFRKEMQAQEKEIVSPTLIGIKCMGGTRYESALRDQDGIWYLSVDTIDRYSEYFYDREAMVFSPESGDRKISVKIDQTNQLAVAGGYELVLEEIYEWNGKIYLPAHQIFPLLETKCKVEGGALVLSQADRTLVKALGGFSADRLRHIRDYLEELNLAQAGIAVDEVGFYEAEADKARLVFARLKEQSPRANDTVWWEFFNSTYDIEDTDIRVTMLDFTGDGVDEMAVSQYRADWSQLDIYMLSEGVPIKIYSENPTETTDDVMMLCGRDDNGQFGIFKVVYDSDADMADFFAETLLYSMSYEFIVFDQDGKSQVGEQRAWSKEDEIPKTEIADIMLSYTGWNLTELNTMDVRPLNLHHNSREDLRGDYDIGMYFGYLEESRENPDRGAAPQPLENHEG